MVSEVSEEEREARVAYHLKIISKNISPENLLRPGLTEEYYNSTVWAYRFFHSKEGAIHMAINPSGLFDPKGYYVQAKRVEEYLRPGMRVLELGAGVGFNSDYLAKANPDVSFVASDGSAVQVKRMKERFANQKNIIVKQIDYQKIDPREDNRFDVVFLVETLCYSSDNKRDLSVIAKTLKPGGRLIIFDGWAQEKARRYPWKQASDWARASMSVDSSWYIEDFLQAAEENFILRKEEDFSQDIMPCLERLHSLSWRFLRRPRLVRVMTKTIPLVAQNSIAGLLMNDLFGSRAWCYKMLVLEKRVNKQSAAKQ